jgi:hypothetical protein
MAPSATPVSKTAAVAGSVVVVAGEAVVVDGVALVGVVLVVGGSVVVEFVVGEQATRLAVRKNETIDRRICPPAVSDLPD